VSLRTKNLYLFILIVLGTIGITFAFSRLMFTRDAYYRSYENQLDITTIDVIFNFQTKIAWIVYLIIPFIMLIKMFMVSICIQIGLFTQNLKLSFGKIFTVVLASEFVFFLPQLIKICWFLLFAKNFTITEVQHFYPLSALNLFNTNDLPIYLIYPFQTFNLFEILYWILLAGGIKQALNTDLDKSIKVVFTGYIPALFLWILCITFVTVLYLPTAKV
jgi:hypothetical protein